ncbi:YhgE/Pip domain-containing protein [Ruminococcus sp.]|uniref:YhgE/Pip domain-containing protein n=1 Tax=Ruminococcus sp. TaxID=41978 RepID=UPI002E76A138|nr:YhgE/Pip domain-containing protein [Ruminococcus sp.]MEE1261736.1 YhgE/Pip domain-containing protein [Ruminococcus sp.]
MKKIFSIFRLDLKSLTKNLIVFVVVIGITILPALYAWFNIAANWDPYSSTGELSFAVCSLDKGSEYKGLKINAGDKIVDNLKKNDKMGWTFVDEDDATQGVKDGQYYAAVVIPEDFTENLMSIVSGGFKQAKLQYYVNEKSNAIAPKITDKGVSAIQESVDATYVSTIAETIAKVLNISEEELEGSKDKLADKITSALNTAKTDLTSFNSSIDLLISTLDSVNDLTKSNKDMVPTIKESLANVGVVTDDVKGMITSAQNTAGQLTTVIDNLISSGDSYAQSISSQLDDAFSTVSTDANAVATKISKIETINQSKITINNKLISILNEIQSNLGVDCSKVVEKLNAANDKQNAIISKIDSICEKIKTTGAVPENAKAEIDQLISDADSAAAAVSSEFNAIKSKIDSALSGSFSKLDSIASFAQTFSGTTDQLDTAFDNATATVDDLKEVLNNLKTYLTNLSSRIDKAVTRVDELKKDDTIKSLIVPIIEDPEGLGEFLSAPVSYDTNRIYPLDNYGSAMTPFYSSLALWVGGVVLVAVLNVDLTERDRKRLGKANPVQLFFGRYLMFFVIGQIQGLIIALGDLFFLKTQADDPVMFIISCLISSFVYSLIIYSLTITFSVIGKALAVIILIMQVAGSGGTFPIEVLPGPFKAIAPFLPFKYGINALRETVAGMDWGNYWYNMGMLLLFIVPALLLGLLLRKPCIKIIAFFNEKVEESDLVI